ncbi:SDR family NAD(P)-dependent oxidoreductase [Spirosoma endbachense]|uniref:SDR family NAD(P)-dependent oxidoreductase n=1 Tax=Spirosoma endbachense TaxID=2666025 RepID=A0A6P1W1U5_9BACT|nr:SDR family NAD(P)-dependent oxidoreductase [Spirosoma endbachense]QHV99401.1 SDR family NAD(P)-dependent oxidoreductase [Spirosoma endbachense]
MATLFITGTSGGLGHVVTQALLNEGHLVIATRQYSDNPQNLIHGFSDLLFTYETDLADEAQVQKLIQRVIHKHGPIDAAVLLAGGYAGGSLTETDGALIDSMMTVNFKTAYHVIQPLFTYMSSRSNGGRFVLIGARQPLNAQFGRQAVAYTLAKSLLFDLSDLINASGKEHDIVSTVIAPSVIDTPANRRAMPDADFTAWVDPQTLADTIAFVLFGAGRALREPILKVYNRA